MWRGESPLRQVRGNDFVVVTSALHREFDDFKNENSMYLAHGSLVPRNELIDVYYRTSKMNTTDVELNGKKYLLMDSFEKDDLCTWIKDKREQVEEHGMTNLLATLYGNKVGRYEHNPI